MKGVPPVISLLRIPSCVRVFLAPGGVFIQGLEHVFAVLFVQGRKADARIFGHLAPEILLENQVVLGFEEEGLQLIGDKLLFGDLDGVLPAGKHAYRVVPYYDHLPLVAVGNKVGTLQVVDPVDDQVNPADHDNNVVFGDPEVRIFEPWNKDQHHDDQGKNGGHDQSAYPDTVSISFVIKFHFFSFAAPF